MEHDDCLLHSFSTSIIEYCNGVLMQNCDSSTFRKCSIKKNGYDFDFSIHLKSLFDSNCGGPSRNKEIQSSFLTEEDSDKLKVVSQSWALHIAMVSVKGSKLYLKLNREHTFYVVLKTILTEKDDYGKGSIIKQEVKLPRHEISDTDLTDRRLSLVTKVAVNLLRFVGYVVTEVDNAVATVHVTSKSSDFHGVTVLCGPVVNSKTKIKETHISAHNYYNIRLEDMKTMSAHKHWASNKGDMLEKLAAATVIVDLLQVNPSHVVTINFESGAVRSRENSTKGATFILYNKARLATIRQQFDVNFRRGVYPALPDFEDINVNLLTEKEEWFILLDFLLEYPVMLRRVAEDFLTGKANLHHVCNFLQRFCSEFSIYYRRVRVLLEPRRHLLPLIFARLQFLAAIEQVFDNLFKIFDIKTIDQM